jgi:hypothetical protein
MTDLEGRIQRLEDRQAITTTNRWEEGNLNAVAEATERVRLRSASD